MWNNKTGIMNYPLLSEYIEAIKSAEDNFDKLSNLRSVLDDNGQPMMSSGNFAVVFKMKDEQTGKLFAVKCFLREQEGRAEAYRMISEELEYVNSTFLTPVKYLDKELFVDTKTSNEMEFSVLLMDWVEGVTLDKYIRNHINDKYKLSLLAYQFSRLAMWLMPQPFAHGDLKPDNILVREDGTMVLVDYDGMYVPAMKGQKARELGSPDFRHPSRIEEDFDEHIDDFPLISILLSLKAISLQPKLLEKFGATDRLLFSQENYNDISKCIFLKYLYPSEDMELNKLIGLFCLSLYDGSIPISLSEKMILPMPSFAIKVFIDSDEYNSEEWQDNFGVYYSKDRKVLIGHKSDWSFKSIYLIPEGTEIIKDYAFREQEYDQRCKAIRQHRKKIVIPSSVYYIGEEAIPGYYEVLCNSPFFKWYKKGLYTCDFKTLVYFPFREGVTREIFLHPNTEKIIFEFVDDVDMYEDSNQDIRQFCSSYYPTSILYQSVPNVKFHLPNNTFLCIPNGTKEHYLKIGYENSSIIEGSVYIDDFGVIYSIDKKRLYAFPFKSPLTDYNILDKCEIINDYAFNRLVANEDYSDPEYPFLFYVNNLLSLNLPKSLVKIGNNAFEGCAELKSIAIPKNVKEIGDDAFLGCANLASVKVNVENVCFDSRDNCNAIIASDTNTLIVGCSSTIIPDNITKIGKCAFYGRRKIETMTIPKSVVAIEESAFERCIGITSMIIPNSVSKIGIGTFEGCYNLKSIILPKSITEIEDSVFEYCKQLKSITIPHKIKKIGNRSFYNCQSITSIKLPNTIKEIGENAFGECYILKSISIPDSVSKLGAKAFRNCAFLSSIKMPNGIIKIEESTFENCEQLKYVTIPNNVKRIGKRAFAGCSNLISIKLSNVTIEIGDYAFQNCGLLNYISIPCGVTKIGEGAFMGCRCLIAIILPDSINEIGREAFLGCDMLRIIGVPKKSKKKFEKMLPKYKDILITDWD